VPFVQVLFPRATMLPVVVGLEDAGECERLGRAVGRVIRDRRALVAASSDLSHYPSAEHARWSDAAVLERMVDLDLPALSQRAGELVTSRVPNLMTAACGLGPVLVAMAVAAEAGARDARVVSYANSSEVAIGDAERVVGYGAVSFSPGVPRADAQVVQNHAPAGPDRLDDEDRRALLALARATITQFLDSETLPLPRDVPTHLQALHHGAFVTLREHGQLRGCIGRVWHDGPLPQLVSAMAYEAAFQDPRFGPVAADEVDDLAVEVSVLTPPQPAEAEAIEPGRHGVLLRKHGRSAVFLPKVATEQGWDREQLLDHLCLKGGLPARAWTRDASLFTFEAEVFGEGAHG
jgi:AmmeMemoRadiSam system protein A